MTDWRVDPSCACCRLPLGEDHGYVLISGTKGRACPGCMRPDHRRLDEYVQRLEHRDELWLGGRQRWMMSTVSVRTTVVDPSETRRE